MKSLPCWIPAFAGMTDSDVFWTFSANCQARLVLRAVFDSPKAMPRHFLMILLAILIALGAAACTPRAWYEGAKQSQRQECYKAPPAAREECLKALDSETYDEYRRNREEQLKK
jgi:hypothetical protein